MQVGKLCTREVITCTPDTSAQAMARLMREHHVGDLLVAEFTAGRLMPRGIVTDRDLVVEVMAAGVPPETITAADLMVEAPTCVNDSDAIEEAIERMSVAGVRRLPVINAHGALVGVLSVDDVMTLLAREVTDIARISRRQRSREAALRTGA
jgi:CBS domain-containing protein